MKTTQYLKTLIYIVLICGLASVANAKSKLITQSQYCTDFATVTMPDSATMLTSFADGQALIRAFNNPTGFYLQIEAADESAQQKLLFNGLTVYIDPSGKGKDKYAVILPVMMSLRQQMGKGGMNQGGMNQGGEQPTAFQDQAQGQRDQNQKGPRRLDFSQLVQQINLKGAIFDIDGDSRAVGIEWVKLTITPNQKICYNIKLPYSVFNLKNGPSAFLSIGLLSEFTLPQGMQGNGGNSNGFGGGGMGGPGGGMGGPGGGGMGGPGGGGMGGPGGMEMGSNNVRSTSTGMGKTIKGWIQVQLENGTH
jgi:hypothetical protein